MRNRPSLPSLLRWMAGFKKGSVQEYSNMGNRRGMIKGHLQDSEMRNRPALPKLMRRVRKDFKMYDGPKRHYTSRALGAFLGFSTAIAFPITKSDLFHKISKGSPKRNERYVNPARILLDDGDADS